MIAINDIHTHRADAASAVISVNPWEFVPWQGRVYSVGIHPWQAAEAGKVALESLSQLATRDDVVMIGECGIDKLRGGAVECQVELVKCHAALSERQRKPLVLHCVRASNELCQLRRSLRPVQPWIIHGFRGNANVARQLLDAGFFLSYGERFNAEAVNATPPGRLLAETDESPVPIKEIYANIAECRHESFAVTASVIERNIAELLSRCVSVEK